MFAPKVSEGRLPILRGGIRDVPLFNIKRVACTAVCINITKGWRVYLVWGWRNCVTKIVRKTRVRNDGKVSAVGDKEDPWS